MTGTHKVLIFIGITTIVYFVIAIIRNFLLWLTFSSGLELGRLRPWLFAIAIGRSPRIVKELWEEIEREYENYGDDYYYDDDDNDDDEL